MWQALGGAAQRLQRQQHPLQPGGALLPGAAAAAHTAARRRRRLSPAGGQVPVWLSPPSEGGESVVVDGSSGRARPLNASTRLPPACGADGAPPPGATACLRDPVLRTGGTEVLLLLTLGGGAAIPQGELPFDAFTIAGNATLVSVSRRTLSGGAGALQAMHWEGRRPAMPRVAACPVVLALRLPLPCCGLACHPPWHASLVVACLQRTLLPLWPRSGWRGRSR